MRLRPYLLTDKAACLAIFDSNTPLYFGVDERPEFAEFLDAPNCDYFVVEDEAATVVGCGGYYVDSTRGLAALCWGMVVRDHHKQGLGQFLLRERLAKICQGKEAEQVLIQTSQHTAGFFEKAGFVTTYIVEDAYAPGLHRYDMGLWLDEDHCKGLGGV